MTSVAEALFRVPPFPRAKPCPLFSPRLTARPFDAAACTALIEAIRRERVGGAFWSADDPWDGWSANYRADDPLALLATIAGQTIQVRGDGPFAALDGHGPAADPAVLHRLVHDYLLARMEWHDPFTGDPCEPTQLIAQLGEWRRLIESNRAIAAAFGFAGWKRDTVAAVLWDGIRVPPFAPARPRRLRALPPDAAVAVWKARVPATFLATVEASGRPLLEVEDGFIRSVGLGADCVPPLSIVLDDLGAHYDPSRPSRLERLIGEGSVSPALLDRAARLAQAIAAAGISKYGIGGNMRLPRPGGDRRHVLVVGQVEDDRSVRLGGCGLTSNLELLRRARAAAPDAYVLYRPHPDVVAGHRKGHVAPAEALALADAIDPGNPISALIAMVDEVHVLTSLAGFEALLHGKAVVTHGVPFYAGWGLTEDRGPVPARRTAKCDLHRLVAAVLILYPRYLDPVTGLPCGPELLIQRMETGFTRENRALVVLRRVFGKLRQVAMH